MNKQFEEYMQSLYGGFNPVSSDELSKVGQRNAKTANEIGKTFADSLKTITNIAQENFRLSIEAAKDLNITDPKSFDMSKTLKDLMANNQKIAEEAQKAQSEISEDISKCANENWKDLTGGACCKSKKSSS